MTTRPREIFINGRFLSQNVTGVQRYALELVCAIDKLLDGDSVARKLSFTLLAPPNVKTIPTLKQIAVRTVGRFRGHLWEQAELPFYSRNGLLVGFGNTGPLFKRNQIVTFCDASVYRVPEAYSFLFRLWYSILLRTVGHLARRVLTISEFSRSELVSCCGIDPNNITVTYPGIDHHDWGGADQGKHAPYQTASRPFVLAVSSMSQHKNFRALVEAITLLGKTDFDVIIAGGTNPAIFKRTDLPLPDTMQHVGYVSDDQLRSLYSRAACFVYPSLYEGFGLPPLEAMANGCPAVVAMAGALPEVCGDAVLYCDPHNTQDIANKIRSIMHDAKLRELLKAKGLRQANRYAWGKCAHETLTVIEKVLAP